MQYQTINNTAKTTGLPAHFLRTLLKQGQLPGFFSGSRFYVNVERLRVQLDSAVGGGCK